VPPPAAGPNPPMAPWMYQTPAAPGHVPLGGAAPPGAWGMDAITAGFGSMGIGGAMGGYGAPPAAPARTRIPDESFKIDPFAEGPHCKPVSSLFILIVL